MKRMPIYVEVLIKGSLDELWEKTQQPQLHKRWDLRFTDIEYLPRESADVPQAFLYATRIGFGMRIEGRGETVGTRDAADGTRTSALKFWSDDWKSLITSGSGFWKYVPTPDGVRFFTQYDYETRFGSLGAFFDAILFRPMIGWATAWSFDRLRLWIERGVEPEESLRRSVIYATSRCMVAFVWFYHGLVPKLLYRQQDELLPLFRLGYSDALSLQLVQVAGIAEILFGFMLLVLWTRRWPLALTAFCMVASLAGVAVVSPELLVKAFNTVTTNLMLFALCSIAMMSMYDLPDANNCLRKPRRDNAA
jgi:hypothetical protein